MVVTKRCIKEMYDFLTKVRKDKLLDALDDILLGLEGEKTFYWDEEDYQYWLFKLGVVEQVIILAQIYPFTQFCDEKGQQLRLPFKRKKTPKGFHPTKRIGYRRFHALLGKGKFLRSSGDKEAWIVSGADICRSHLYIWAKRVIVRRNHKGIVGYWYAKTDKIKTIQDKYDSDIGLGNKTLENLAQLSDLEQGVSEAKKVISDKAESALSALLNALMPLLDEVVKKKHSKEYLTQKGTTVLGDWAKSRATDKLVKMLRARIPDGT